MARPKLLGGRAAAPPPPSRPGLRVASGRAIDVTDRTAIAAYRKRMMASIWQEPATVFSGTIPPLQFAHMWVKNSMSRVRPFAAILSEEPDEGPVPLTDETTPDPDLPDLCDQIVRRLHPFPDFMGQVALKLDVIGEAYVGLMPDDDALEGEVCRVFSNKELLAVGGEWRIRQAPEDSIGEPIPDGTPFWRIWTPDPDFHVLPWSPMVALNTTCETYLTFMRELKANSLSRLSSTGKIVLVADEFTLESAVADGMAPSEDAGDGAGMDDTFFDDFQAAAAQAILDPESPSAVLPLIVRGPLDLIDKGFKVVDMSRSMEAEWLKVRAELREEIATGVDIPREIVLGIGITNHWNAEEIKQQAWLNHLEPRAYSILAATTTAYFHPALVRNGVDPDVARRLVIWYDPTWFLGEPDQAESADFGYEHYLISADAWRDAKNYSPDDAPSQDEVEWRIHIKQGEQVRTTIREPEQVGITPPTVEPYDVQPPADTDEEDQEQEIPETPDKSAPAPAASPKKKPTNGQGKPKAQAAALDTLAVYPTPRVASARPSDLDRLGSRLVGIEPDLRARLLQACDGTLGRALEIAGLKVKMKLGRKGKAGQALLAQLNGEAPCEIPATLGRAALEAFDLKDTELLAGALGDLEVKWRRLVWQAQQAAARVAGQAVGGEPDYEALDEATKQSRDAGWDILAAGLTGLAMAALYNPHPEAPAVGEFDPSSLVPPGLVRAALEAAGGARLGDSTQIRGADVPSTESPVAGDGTVPGGATAGPEMLAQFADQFNIAPTEEYVWIHGDPPRDFPPHADLDTQTFTSWDDEVLANDGGWPDVDFYSPGDHAFCTCDAARSFAMEGGRQEGFPGVGVEAPDQLTRTEKADALDQPRPARA